MNGIERIKCGNGNCFLVRNGGNAILVDTSRVQFRDRILKQCENKNVRLIVLTHGHIDHIQNAAFLSKELNVPIAMHKADYELIKNNLAEPLSAHSLLGKLILRMSMSSFENDKVDPFEPAVFLSEGDALDKYGIRAAIIMELPGHTKGSIGVIIGDTDMIVGDALMNMFYPTKSPLYGNRADMEKSAERIGSLGNIEIHFGHGKSVKNRDW